MQFKILIAEDEQEFRDILVSIVEMIFVKYYPSLELLISVAGNGQEELSIAQEESQDIIITDINMPVMDGKEAVHKIRLFDKSVPILALTALTDVKDVDEIIQSGVSNYAVKPLNKKIFIAQIQSYVNLFVKSGFLYNRKAINRISKQVFKRKIIFDIDCIENIEEFWEYFLENNSKLSNDYIQDILQSIYNFELWMLKKGILNEIILEENEENYYVTISKLEQLKEGEYNEYLSLNKIDMESIKKDTNLITFLVSKNEDKEIEVEVIQEETPIEQLERELEEARELDLRYTTHEKVSAQELSDELDPSIEDKLENFEEDIDLLRLSLYDLEDAQGEDIQKSLLYVAKLFGNFNYLVENIGLFNVINRAFKSFVSFLENLEDAIIVEQDKRILLVTFIRGLVDDLEQWIVNVFLEHTTSDIHYFDASFAENCLMIEKIFLADDDEEDISDEDDDSLEFF